MTLNEEQKKKVEENMGLVGKVIKDKIHGAGQMGIYSYEDLMQIGYIGLCKAAYTDKGGCFSTYAYRIIYNTLMDAIVQINRQNSFETAADYLEGWNIEKTYSDQNAYTDLKYSLKEMEKKAPKGIRKGIRALLLSAEGYSSAEIGKKYHGSENTVRVWISRARKYLKLKLPI